LYLLSAQYNSSGDGYRVHVKREDKATLVLHVDSVRRRDEGQYSCESDFDGQLGTEHAQLIIYGQLTRTCSRQWRRGLVVTVLGVSTRVRTIVTIGLSLRPIVALSDDYRAR